MKKKKYILGIVICILITVLTGYSTADNILNNQTMNSIENNINIIDYLEENNNEIDNTIVDSKEEKTHNIEEEIKDNEVEEKDKKETIEIPDGIYKIYSKLSADRLIEDPNNSRSQKTYFKLGANANTASQKFEIKFDSTDGTYTVLANLIQKNLNGIGIQNNINGGIVKRNIDREPKYQYLMDGKVVQADYYADIRCAMKGDTLNYGPDLNTNTGVPTILVEHCFMNSSDIKFLDSDKDLKKIANADSKAIINYFGLKLK